MSIRPVLLAISLLILCTAGVVSEPARAAEAAHPHYSLSDEGQAMEPFKVFDNLYFIGMKYVASWLIVTSEGLIMIDTLFGDPEFKDYLVGNIEKLGFDPMDLKLILISQGHPDHHGQAFALQDMTGARIGTGLGDWELIENDLWSSIAPKRDWVIEHGDFITMGDTTINLEILPGHTAGTLGIEFPVRDGDDTFLAFLHGGTSIRTHDPAVLNRFIRDAERLKTYDRIDVQINNHPFIDDLFDRKVLLDARKPGEPHPFVDQAMFRAFLDRRIGVAQDQLKGIVED